MSSNNHTPIVVGAPANASIVNAPLGELDETIGNIDNLGPTNKSSLVAAIGTAALTTAEKSSLVAAINSIFGEVNTARWGEATLSEIIGDPSIIAALSGSSILAKVRSEYLARVAEDVTINDRIDNLGVEAGNANAEVTAARTSINYGTTPASLSEVLRVLGGDVFLAELYGFSAVNGGADNATALQAAIAAAVTAGGGVVKLPAGTFTVNNIAITGNDVALVGAGKPQVNAAKNGLEGGTILSGCQISFGTYKGCSVENLGVVITGNKNCITSGGSNATTGGYSTVRNVVVMGDSTSGAHGCVFTDGHYNTVDGFSAYNLDHGLVFRCSFSNASNVYFYDCITSSITIKALGSSGSAENAMGNNLTNVIAEASGPTTAQGISIEGDDLGANCRDNSISNAKLIDVQYGIIIKTLDLGAGHGLCTRTTLNNVHIYSPTYDGILISGEAQNVTISNCYVNTVSGGRDAYINSSSNTTIDVINSFATNTAAADEYSGIFRTLHINGRFYNQPGSFRQYIGNHNNVLLDSRAASPASVVTVRVTTTRATNTTGIQGTAFDVVMSCRESSTFYKGSMRVIVHGLFGGNIVYATGDIIAGLTCTASTQSGTQLTLDFTLTGTTPASQADLTYAVTLIEGTSTNATITASIV